MSTSEPLPFCWESFTPTLKSSKGTLLEEASKETTALVAGHAITIITGAVAFIISTWIIIQHLRHYSQPEYQRYIVRIVIVVPITSVLNIVNYKLYNIEPHINVIKYAVSGLAVASLLRLMMLMLVGGIEDELNDVFRNRKAKKLLFPLNCFTFRPGATCHLPLLRLATYQFSLIQLIIGIAMSVLFTNHVYCPHHLLPMSSTPLLYLHLLLIGSGTIALYGLGNFYATAQSDLQEELGLLRLVPLLILIFLPTHLPILVDLLVEYGAINDGLTTSKEGLGTMLECLIINFELMILAILFYFKMSFNRFEYWDPKHTKVTCSTLKDVANIWETVADMLTFLNPLLPYRSNKSCLSATTLNLPCSMAHSTQSILKPGFVGGISRMTASSIDFQPQLNIKPRAAKGDHIQQPAIVNIRELRQQSVLKIEKEFDRAIQMAHIKNPSATGVSIMGGPSRTNFLQGSQLQLSPHAALLKGEFDHRNKDKSLSPNHNRSNDTLRNLSSMSSLNFNLDPSKLRRCYSPHRPNYSISAGGDDDDLSTKPLTKKTYLDDISIDLVSSPSLISSSSSSSSICSSSSSSSRSSSSSSSSSSSGSVGSSSSSGSSDY